MRKNIKSLLFLFGIALTLSYVSCTDENKFINPVTHGLEKGAFPSFATEAPAAAYPDPLKISFSNTITDPNNNISSYSLKLIATLSGSVIVKEDFFTSNTFPVDFSFTTESLANAIGVQPADIKFGDTFNFVSTTTRDDGAEFTGIAPAFSTSTLVVSGGNTEAQLQTAGYRSAMQFNFIVACPFIQADMVGTYTISDADGFHASGGGTSGAGETFEVIAGAEANEVIMVNPLGSAGNFNIKLTVSEFGLATFDAQDAVQTPEICSSAPVCTQGTPTTFRSNANTSLSLSCIGLIQLQFSTRFSQGGSNWSFGDGTFIANKN